MPGLIDPDLLILPGDLFDPFGPTMPLSYPNLFAAAPFGLEVKLTYNGLTLNANKTNYPAMQAAGGVYYVDEITGLDDADIRMAAEVRPDWDGENPLQTFYGGRTITITGRIFGMNMYQLRLLQSAMRKSFGIDMGTEKALVFDTGVPASNVQIMCRKSAPLQMKEAKQAPSRHTVRDFMITLRASDPRFLSTASTSVNVTNPGTSGVLMPLATNQGNYYADPIITIHGPVSAGCQIDNTTTGGFLRLDSALGATDILTIDFKKRTLQLATGANAYSYLAGATQWFRMAPGSNQLQALAGASATAATSITVAWQHAFI